MPKLLYYLPSNPISHAALPVVDSYRLCPADSPLTEECFQKRHLDFVGQGSLRWGGVGGEQIFYNASDVNVGTIPKGSTWRKCPIREYLPYRPCSRTFWRVHTIPRARLLNHPVLRKPLMRA